MSEDLRIRGIAVLGHLREEWNEAAWATVREWETECITAYPALKHLGPFSPEEHAYAVGLVKFHKPRFTLAHSSTYVLDAEAMEATAIENGVRLYRLQHGGVKLRGKGGRPQVDDRCIVNRAHAIMEKQERANKTQALWSAIDEIMADFTPEQKDAAHQRIYRSKL